MARYALGILTAFLFLASVCALLYIFDQGDVIDLKPSVLVALSHFPGWEDLYETYNIGRLEARVVEEKEQQLAEKEQMLAELRRRMEEKEATWAVAERKYEMETARLKQRVEELEAIRQVDYAASARLLEAMKPEVAAEALLGMPFEMGVAVLAAVEPRRAGRILDTLPPEDSARYLEKLTLP